MMSGILEAIWIKRARRGPMDLRSRATLKSGQGIVDNANQGGECQVTIIQREVWSDLMRKLGASLDPSTRRANLMLSGIRLAESHDRVLQVGDCRILIRGETKPCERMEEACPGLQDAMRPNWGGGAYGEVLNDCEISVGDPIRWLAEDEG
ncbi:MAG: MOSC domain-containing protein [Gemmatimonadales bacterium]|nr:MOSC domain-containing protein [Gemmatimonadales bacterium]NIN10522.1 MOSC domain-containing protein [Gemmatimonadales bacterium]NIN49309.1 MOSC domain-containing protein [Gemmatimonadales bacterium]NIP06773.1 MOSC domain-containing protein [Gemmatimonadales bacterium]NIR02799.1 MOSC domain-containing protein [Gemmatimonadales bacterium]